MTPPLSLNSIEIFVNNEEGCKAITAKNASYEVIMPCSKQEKIWAIFNKAMFAISVIGTITLMTTSPGLLAAYTLKVVVGLAWIVTLRKTIAVMLYLIIYPATLNSMRKGKKSDACRLQTFKDLTQLGYQCRRITLKLEYTDGKYDAFIITHPKHDPKNWTLYCDGNQGRAEHSLHSKKHDRVRYFSQLNSNLLYVNGPGVCRSSGLPTNHSIGAGQRLGWQFLEKIGVENLLIYTYSIGGGAFSEAVQQRKNEIPGLLPKKQVVWDRTFEKLSSVSRDYRFSLAPPFMALFGLQLNTIEAAKILSQHKIPQVVIQHDTAKHKNDKVVSSRASLKDACLKEIGETPDIVYYTDLNADHFSDTISEEAQGKLNQQLSDFFKRNHV